MPRNPTCEKCPLHQEAGYVCVWGAGNQHAPIMLVGEAPGQVEDQTGIPFQGPAGQVLDYLLSQSGLERNDVYITNIAKCRPPGNREPTREEERACFPYLAEEIEAVQPKVIIALGGTALEVLVGKKAVGRARGHSLQPASYLRTNAKLLATKHPAAYLNNKNRSTLQEIITDLKFAETLLHDKERAAALPAHETSLLPPGYTAEDLDIALHSIENCNVLSMDCEWTYAEDRKIAWPWTRGAELYSISLSGRVGKVISSVAFSYPLPNRAFDILSQFLQGRKLVFQNAMSDLIWLSPTKLPVRLAGDTLYLSYLLDETGAHSLEALAEQYIGLPDWKEDLWPHRPQSQEAWEKLLSYNATDTYATLLIMEKLYERVQNIPEVERIPLMRIYTQLMLPATPMFVRLAHTGMPMNPQLIVEDIRNRRQQLVKAGEQLGSIINRKSEQAIEVASSPAQVTELLRSSYGIDVDTTNEYVMEDLAEEYPVAALIQKIKHLKNKVLRTYLEPWYQLMTEQETPWLHSVYSLVNSVTGRTTTQTEIGAAVQLVPRESKEDGEYFRHHFEAPEGYVILSADYKTIEMCVAGWVANEPTMLKIANDRESDFHYYTASAIVNKPRSQISPKERQDAKPVNFGFLYGMGADKFGRYAKKNYGVPFTTEQSQFVRNRFFMLYPKLQEWYKRCEEKFRKGYVITVFGQVRRSLPDANKVSNTEVQGPSTQIAELAGIEIDRILMSRPDLDAKLIAFVHDSWKAIAPNDHRAQEVAKIIQENMENPPLYKLGVEKLPFPLVAEVKMGRNWGEVE